MKEWISSLQRKHDSRRRKLAGDTPSTLKTESEQELLMGYKSLRPLASD